MQLLSANSELILKRLIESSGDISISDIQQSCSLSRKQIAIELQRIDESLRTHGARIKPIQGKGYQIQIFDPARYAAYSRMFLYHNQRNEHLYLERNALAYRILFDLILNDGYVTMSELAERHHYAVGTISKNLGMVKHVLGKYGCELVSRPRHGLIVQGSEWHKRIAIIHADKIAFRLYAAYQKEYQLFSKCIDRVHYSMDAIERMITSVLNEHALQIPCINLVKLRLYVVLSQTRGDRYDELAFTKEQVEEIAQSKYRAAGRALALLFQDAGFLIRQGDEMAITAMLCCFCPGEEDLGGDVRTKTYHEDTLGLIAHIKSVYPGVERFLDDGFVREFSGFLAGLGARCLFCLPTDEESVFQVKRDGAFVSDVCKDIAMFYKQRYAVELPESEILLIYYIVHNSFARHNAREARYRIVLVSRHGIHFARSVASRLLEEYRTIFASIDVMEYTRVGVADLSGCDFIITDIERDRFDFVDKPIINLDFYRNPSESRSLNQHLAALAAAELRELVKDENLVRNKCFNDKRDVYGYLADHYIDKAKRQAFIDDCLNNDELLSDERRNRIALISSSSRFYDKKEIVILFNKTPFRWHNEQVQMIVFFNRRNRDYLTQKPLNAALITLLHANAGLAAHLSKCDASGIVDYIVSAIYP